MITYITYSSADIIKKAVLVNDAMNNLYGDLLFKSSEDLIYYINTMTVMCKEPNNFNNYSLGKRKFFIYHACQIERLTRSISANLEHLDLNEDKEIILTQGMQNHIHFFLNSIIKHASKMISMEVN